MDLEDKKYFSECRRSRILKTGKYVAETIAAFGLMVVGVPIVSASMPVVATTLTIPFIVPFVKAGLMATVKGYGDLSAVLSGGKTICQADTITNRLICDKKTRKQLENIQEKPSDIAMVMTEQIVLLLDKEKRSLQDKKTNQVTRKDGTDAYVYDKMYDTTSHSSNIGTLIQLHEMGYIDINSIDFDGKSHLTRARFGADVASHGFFKATAKLLSEINPLKKAKRDEYEMYKVKFHLTSKPIDFDEIIETMSDKEKQKQLLSKEMDIDYLSKDEKKLPDEKKSEIIAARKKRTKNNTKLAARLIRKGLALVSVDGCRVTYVKEGSKESVLSKYQEKKEKEEKAKSWMEVENYQENEKENIQQMDKNTGREEFKINNKQATEIEDEAKSR